MNILWQESVIPECALFSFKNGENMSIKNFIIKSRAYLTAVRNLKEGVVKQNSLKTGVNIENRHKFTKKLQQHLLIKEFAGQNVMKKIVLGQPRRAFLRHMHLDNLYGLVSMIFPAIVHFVKFSTYSCKEMSWCSYGDLCFHDKDHGNPSEA